ncbi:hypothetical protein GCM10010961_06920 [Pseudodonghicola xiamenensis]|uniref:Uncharacterized protein n=1 Tax=Pseudodonghicola xiamenensis TaxID=337702 RepID=A0A8J3H3D3_9RHOB|nr:hypothetical protein GCM10010961_06920 [Pseudodonghicola xiamenensis]
MVALANTVERPEASAADYDPTFNPDGHGLLWELTKDAASIALLEDSNAAGNKSA